MPDLNEKILLEQLAWVHRRLEALDTIEAKLKQMRELAVYAASRTLSEKEVAQVQEWVDILQAEADVIDQETALGNPVLTNLTIFQMPAKKSIQ